MKKQSAFTLVEVLVSVAILAALMTVLLSITGSTQAIWKRTEAKASQFRSSRNAFESINRRLRQATLNTYWDYDDPVKPTKYTRRSELRFISGPANNLGVSPGFTGGTAYGHAAFFQAPFGYSPANPLLNKLLNTWGYYVALTDGKAELPGFIASGAADNWRLRLYEMMEPSENLSVYNVTSGNPNSLLKTWFQTPVAKKEYSHVLADNIVALIVRPKENLTTSGAATAGSTGNMDTEVKDIAPNYLYDSSGGGELSDTQRAQLPPILQVTLVAIDDDSAKRLTKQQLAALGKTSGDFFSSSSKDMETKLQLDSSKAASYSLENFLVNHKPPVNYRVYTSNINISGSKWSDAKK